MTSFEEQLNDAPEEADHSSSSIGRKVAVGVAGSVVTAAGVVMLVTPGLGILGSEFPAARRILHRLRRRGRSENQG